MTAPATRVFTNRRLWRLLFLLTVTIGSDQASKYVAREFLPPSGSSYLFDTVRLSLVENHGGFLGVVASLPAEWRFLLLTVGVAVLLGGCLIILLRLLDHASPLWLPLALITGGGLGNLLDRLRGDGGVTDFLILGRGFLQTGIFNLADVYILTGSFILGAQLLQGPDKPQGPRRE
jgi:signal peptidase II